MLYPRTLKNGDRVGLIAPAGPVKSAIMDKVIKTVEDMGLVPVEGRSARAKEGFLAGNDFLRADDINTMFKDRSISGIFCLRGGYGSQRLIDKIDWKAVKANPKIFTGYSDITVLLAYINKNCRFITFHGPMLASELYKESLESYSFMSLKDNIFKKFSGEFQNPPSEELFAFIDGEAEGVLTGGNLSMITSSIGTPYEIDIKDKILFLEEVDEEPYKIDKMLNQLKNTGCLSKVSGFLIGYFLMRKNHDEDYYKEVMEIIRHYIEPLGKPAVSNVCCGHKLPSATLALGARCKIKGNRIWIYP
ncbi:S66 peptidase family protein [Anaeropeptidivorans aminofermentans]|jgi:muramoyltetrapeptide carboxypeptidase|uniref:S66 peptidase family protein n=1 Tax=Anaeropeptidivorans aminofermentans TaxID=2934315 RepID=UPI00202529B3|nr:LD-carboxypeptidase [Anaeropeptidivorans aminofermentans]